jgi:hypothetical protein
VNSWLHDWITVRLNFPNLEVPSFCVVSSFVVSCSIEQDRNVDQFPRSVSSSSGVPLLILISTVSSP